MERWYVNFNYRASFYYIGRSTDMPHCIEQLFIFHPNWSNQQTMVGHSSSTVKMLFLPIMTNRLGLMQIPPRRSISHYKQLYLKHVSMSGIEPSFFVSLKLMRLMIVWNIMMNDVTQIYDIIDEWLRYQFRLCNIKYYQSAHLMTKGTFNAMRFQICHTY